MSLMDRELYVELFSFKKIKKLNTKNYNLVSYPANEVVYKWKEQNISVGWFPIQIDDGVKLSQYDLLGTAWNGSQYEIKGMK